MITLSIALLASTFAYADAPPTGSVTIRDLTYQGDGCPQGSVAYNISPDNQAMTVLFDQFVVDSTEVRTPRAAKNCKLRMQLDAPPGWSYALFCVDYRGFADLSPGATASTFATYKFGMSREKRLGGIDLTGPFSDDYTKITQLPLSEIPWSRCGNRNGQDVLTIDTTAVVAAPPFAGGIDLHMASGGGRKAEYPQSDAITDIRIVRQASAAPCVKNRSFGFQGNVAWVNFGCRGDFRIVRANDQVPRGLLTVDSVDGHVKQHYGVSWKRCGTDGGGGGNGGGNAGATWVQSDGRRTCDQVCAGAGLSSAPDVFGAMCVSGESRPTQAAGIAFPLGCWGACTPMGNIATQAEGHFCYQPGQRRDGDRTDRIVGCHCQ
jgi:hypothetical protein